MANRKDFMISKLIDIVLSWTDDINLAIQEMVDEGIQPNELLDYFDANSIVEALSNNETPPEIAAVTEQEKANEIFDNADTLPDNSELIEGKSTTELNYFHFIEILDEINANYRKLGKYTIELCDDSDSVDFIFDKNFKLASVEW